MKYHITYSVTPHPEGIEKEAVPADHGACTALILGSLLYPDDGSCNLLFLAIDGRTGQPLSDAEIWKAWVFLTKQIAESSELVESKKVVCRAVWDAVCAAIGEGT